MIEHISEYEPIVGNVTAARPAKRHLLETGQPIPARRVRRMLETGPAIYTKPYAVRIDGRVVSRHATLAEARAMAGELQGMARMERTVAGAVVSHDLGVPLAVAAKYAGKERP